MQRRKRLHNIVNSNMIRLDQHNFRLLGILRCIESCQNQYDSCVGRRPDGNGWCTSLWIRCTNACKNHMSKQLKEYEKNLKKIIASTNKDIRALTKN